MSHPHLLPTLRPLPFIREEGKAGGAAAGHGSVDGTALIKGASAMLEEAEQRVVKLQKGPDGEPIESKFIEEEEK